MLLTTKEEILELKDESGLTWEDLANLTGKTRCGTNSTFRGCEHLVPQSYVKIIEAMGYDIKLRFVKR